MGDEDLTGWLADEADRAPALDPTTVSRGLDGGRARVARRRRRTTWGAVGGAVAVVAAVAVTVAVVEPGGTSAERLVPAGPSPLPSPAEDLPVETLDGEALVSCGGRGFRPSVMADGLPDVLTEPEARTAFRTISEDPRYGGETRRSFPGGPDAVEWRVLSFDGTVYELALGPRDEANPAGTQYLSMERSSDGWRAVVFGGRCSLEPVLAEGLTWMEIGTYQPDPAATSLVVSATETACASGRDPRGHLEPFRTIETATSVTVYGTIDTFRGGADCPGNPSIDVDVPLQAPLGDRTVLDGSSYPPRPVQPR